jgi:hypothetical protein
MKFSARAKQWEDTKCGLFWNTLYYNTFVVPTLEFVAQLEEMSPAVLDTEACALRKLALGPGSWISLDDLEHLGLYGIGNGFRMISHTAKAAKLRLLNTLGGTYVRHCKERILSAQADSLRRPFGAWHSCGYAKVVHDNERTLAAANVHRGLIIRFQLEEKKASFQKISRELIVRSSLPYSMEERVRKNPARWKFAEPLNYVTHRIIRNMKLFASSTPPAVRSSYLRALWNGVPTTRRMRSMPGFKCTNCVFGCSPTACDSLEHYCRCTKIDGAVARYYARGSAQPIDDFFGVVKGMSPQQKILRGQCLHIKLRLIHFARRFGHEHDFKFLAEVE